MRFLLVALAALALAGTAQASPKGVVITLHGGGWANVGPTATRAVQPEADRFKRWGFKPINSTYHPGRDSVAYVLNLYDRLRERHPSLPIHVYGESAGGHLALMLAAKRPVGAVVTVGAPTDLTRLGDGPRASFLRHYSEPAFGYGEEAAPFSPALLPTKAQAVLLGREEGDPAVPRSQWTRYLDNHAGVARMHILEAGPRRFVHGTVTREALRKFHQAQKKLLLYTSTSTTAPRSTSG